MSSQSQQTNPGIQKKNTLLNDLKASLKEEQTKVEKIDKIIEKLETAKKTIISQKQGQVSTSYSRILEKYITFLNYIKSIIKAKIEKDEKITRLQWEVFHRIDKIGEGINLTKTKLEEINIEPPNTEEIERTKLELNSLKEKSNQLNSQLNKKNKQYLLDFNASSEGVGLYDNTGTNIDFNAAAEAAALKCNVEITKALNTFNTELQRGQSGGMNITEQKSSEMNDYTSDDKEQFKAIIESLSIENTNGQIINILKTNNLENNIINNNINSKQKIQKKQIEHTEKLKNIKKAYEDGLQKNIEDFKKICEALKNLVETVNKKTEFLRKNIDKIKKNVNASKTKRDNEIKEIKDKIENNENNKKRIQELKEEIEEKKQQNIDNKIMLKVLNTSFLDNVFKKNHKALVGEDGKSGLLGEITKAQKGLNSAKITVQGVNVNNPSQSPAQDRGPGTGNPSQGNPDQGKTTLVKQPTGQQGPASGTQGQPSSQAQGTPGQLQGKTSTQVISISKDTTVKTDTLIMGLVGIKKENNIKIENLENVRKDINNKLDALEKLISTEGYNTDQRSKLEEEIKNLFEGNYYNLPDDLKIAFEKITVPRSKLTEQEKYYIFRYISLLTYSGDFEEGLKVLNPEAKELINKILDTNDSDERKKLLIDLYEKRPNRIQGGKYKKKKSKNSNSKSKSKTSKAKSTKKQKATRTQVKSYNNPKYKNQDGGFVRGGVLFPESFYRSDIVM